MPPPDPGIAHVVGLIARQREAGDLMFDALARLADRATLPFPKYALQAMEQWASVTGRDMPVPEITVRVEPVHYPTPEEDEL